MSESNLDLAAIREALAAQLDTIDGLFVYRQWPGQPSILPCIVLWPPESIDYSRTFQRGLDIATWHLVALVGPVSPTSQAFLEGLMSGTGALSVITCLRANPKLEGLISNSKVTGVESGIYSLGTGGNDSVIGCEITLEVAA